MSNEQAQWLTVKEAAQATGKSERTIRRWIATGRLSSTRVDDGPLLVDVTGTPPATPGMPEAQAPTGAEQADATGTPQAETDRLRAEVAMLRDERDYLRDALAREQAVAASIQRLLPAQAESQRPRPGLWPRVKAFFVGEPPEEG